jgi:hypothetical protein
MIEVEKLKTAEQSAELIEKVLALVERKRNKALDRQTEHADKRRALSFDAHAGDGKQLSCCSSARPIARGALRIGAS